MSEEIVGYSLDGDVAVLRWDDGGANVVSTRLTKEMNAHLDRAAEEAKTVAILGRPGRFCAGFDLSVMKQGGAAVTEMVGAGARLALRLYGHPTPVVIGCTGHCLAMGAILLLAADSRIGTAGSFKLGLNEVAIGMTMPYFGAAFAEERLSPTHYQRSVAVAEIFDPEEARRAGFLDRVVEADALEAAVMAEAQRTAALDMRAYAGTVGIMRAEFLERVGKSVEAFG
jgi:enoyl-CoA hydratase